MQVLTTSKMEKMRYIKRGYDALCAGAYWRRNTEGKYMAYSGKNRKMDEPRRVRKNGHKV